MTEDEMAGWHHRLNGHEFEQGPGDGEGQGSLVCATAHGVRKSDKIERLNNNSNKEVIFLAISCPNITFIQCTFFLLSPSISRAYSYDWNHAGREK